VKKKISFDIEEEDFLKIKKIVESTNLGQGEFLRRAVSNAIVHQENLIKDNLTTIWILDGIFNFDSYLVNLNNYEYTLEEANESQKKALCGVKKVGKITKINAVNLKDDEKIFQLLKENGNILFFIK